MTALLTPLLLTLGPAALLVVMAVVFAESGLLLGVVLPGDSLLFLAGALVTSHVIALPIWLVAAGVVLAAAAGDQVGYLLGRRFGPSIFSRPGSRLLRPEHVGRAHAFFARRGDVAVVIARFLPVVRTLTPAVAGAARMPRRRFTTFNLLGALVWGAGVVTVGALFGGVPFVAAHIELITIGLALLSVVPLTVEVLRRRSGRGRHVDDRQDGPVPQDAALPR